MLPVASYSYCLSEQVTILIQGDLWHDAKILMNRRYTSFQNQTDEEFYLTLANLFWNHSKISDDGDFFDYTKKIASFLDTEQVPKVATQSIKLLFFMRYSKVDDLSDKEFFELLEKIKNEFEDFPLQFWFENDYFLLFASELEDDFIYDRLCRLFVGDVRLPWEEKIDHLLRSVEHQNQSLELIDFILKDPNCLFSWTPEKVDKLCDMLHMPSISFLLCSSLARTVNHKRVNEILLKLLIEKPYPQHYFLFFYSIAHIEELGNVQDLIALAKLSKKESKTAYLRQSTSKECHQYLSIAVIHFNTFALSQERDIRVRFADNFLRSILSTWRLGVECYLMDDWNLFFEQLNLLKIDDSFDYLTPGARYKLFLFGNEMQRRLNITTGEECNQLFLKEAEFFQINASWAGLCVNFLIRHKVNPSTADLFLNNFLPVDKSFEWICAIKETMESYPRRGPHFNQIYFEVLNSYVQLSQVEIDDEFIETLSALGKQTDITPLQRSWINDYIWDYQIASTGHAILFKLLELDLAVETLTVTEFTQIDSILQSEIDRKSYAHFYEFLILRNLKKRVKLSGEQQNYIRKHFQENPEGCRQQLLAILVLAKKWVGEWGLDAQILNDVCQNLIFAVEEVLQNSLKFSVKKRMKIVEWNRPSTGYSSSQLVRNKILLNTFHPEKLVPFLENFLIELRQGLYSVHQ